MQTTEARTAAQIAEDRLTLANKVKGLRDEVVSADESIRAEKAVELQSAIDELENCDSQYRLTKALENANALVEKLSQEPDRPKPVFKSATLDRSGNVLDGGDLNSPTETEALSSRDYAKAFNAFLEARGKIDGVKSRNHRDMLERYGKGHESGLSANEIFMPFTKDMTSLGTSTGSNAIAPDFRFDVITPRTYQPVMAGLCRTITTNVNQVTFPKNNDTNSDTRYGTTFRPSKGESPNGTANKKDTGPFGTLVVPANTGSMYTDISRDFFLDAPGMSAYLQNEAAKAFAAVVDDEVINGVTGSTQAEGILTNTSIGITKSGTANTLAAAKIKDAFYSFRSQYAQNLSWVMARGTHGAVLGLNDSAGRALFSQNSLGGYNIGINPDMFGKPVYFNEFMPATGASSPKSILVGDFSEYILLMRQGFTVLVDDISQAYLNRIRVSFNYRFGGAVRDPKAFQILHESA